jgi:4-hydroxybenzoate polyprenyltransferase
MISTSIADAAPENWVTRYLPESIQPYAQLMRLDRPIGWWLLLLPCWWGLALAHIAQGTTPDIWYAFLFFAGAVIMRGAGCTVNDVADHKIDALVERTRHRPIPSGRISVSAALVFLVAQLLAGLIILLQFNRYTIVLAICSLAIVAIYPFMKRITYFPQVILGLAFNWGALLGWTAIHQGLAAPPVLLYLGGIFWTLAYDTVYAHQDKEDDMLIGVKSTALKFGDATPKYLVVFFAAALILILASCILVGTSWTAYIALTAAACHAAWQVKTFNGNDPKLCLKLFKANRTFGLIILFGLLTGLFLT